MESSNQISGFAHTGQSTYKARQCLRSKTCLWARCTIEEEKANLSSVGFSAYGIDVLVIRYKAEEKGQQCESGGEMRFEAVQIMRVRLDLQNGLLPVMSPLVKAFFTFYGMLDYAYFVGKTSVTALN